MVDNIFRFFRFVQFRIEQRHYARHAGVSPVGRLAGRHCQSPVIVAVGCRVGQPAARRLDEKEAHDDDEDDRDVTKEGK